MSAPTDPIVPQSCTFGHLGIAFDNRVLRPRAWTALQSSWAAEVLESTDAQAGERRILELCAGVGHIGLLAASLAQATLVCVDIDPHACELARLNADAAQMRDHVEVRCLPLEESLVEGETFDVVVADPPWVPREEVSMFPEDPLLAIDGGPDGLDLARACLTTAGRALRGGGTMLVQLGTEAQADRLRDEAGEAWLSAEVRRGARGVVLRLDLA